MENSFSYNAYGMARKKEENIHNQIRYTGQQYDQVIGQYYLRSRFYNPVVGRFLQEDEYHGDGLNLYAYCGNNPVVYYDPSGYSSSTLLNDELKIGEYKDVAKQYKAGKTGLTPHHMTSDVKDMKHVLQKQNLYNDYAKDQLRDYIRTQEKTAYSSDSKLVNNPDFNGKEIKNEQIFSKDYEDNQTKQNDGCKGR